MSKYTWEYFQEKKKFSLIQQAKKLSSSISDISSIYSGNKSRSSVISRNRNSVHSNSWIGKTLPNFVTNSLSRKASSKQTNQSSRLPPPSGSTYQSSRAPSPPRLSYQSSRAPSPPDHHYSYPSTPDFPYEYRPHLHQLDPPSLPARNYHYQDPVYSYPGETVREGISSQSPAIFKKILCDTDAGRLTYSLD